MRQNIQRFAHLGLECRELLGQVCRSHFMRVKESRDIEDTFTNFKWDSPRLLQSGLQPTGQVRTTPPVVMNNHHPCIPLMVSPTFFTLPILKQGRANAIDAYLVHDVVSSMLAMALLKQFFKPSRHLKVNQHFPNQIQPTIRRTKSHVGKC